jgi:hypothetical protein
MGWYAPSAMLPSRLSGHAQFAHTRVWGLSGTHLVLDFGSTNCWGERGECVRSAGCLPRLSGYISGGVDVWWCVLFHVSLRFDSSLWVRHFLGREDARVDGMRDGRWGGGGESILVVLEDGSWA